MQVDGYSLDAQRDKLRKYAAYEDMIVAGEYSDEGFPERISKRGRSPTDVKRHPGRQRRRFLCACL